MRTSAPKEPPLIRKIYALDKSPLTADVFYRQALVSVCNLLLVTGLIDRCSAASVV